MTELLDTPFKEGTPLQDYLGDAKTWIEDFEDSDDLMFEATRVAIEHKTLHRVIQLLVAAGKVTWDDVDKAIGIASDFA